MLIMFLFCFVCPCRISAPADNPIDIGESCTENFCVEGTDGAEFHPDLQPGEQDILMTVSIDPNEPNFSAFSTNENAAGIGQLQNLLWTHDITHLYLAGFGFEYGIVRTALDAHYSLELKVVASRYVLRNFLHVFFYHSVLCL